MYKTIIYAAAWLAALFATNPSAGYWSMAFLFPLGLAAFISLRLGNDGGWWVYGTCIAIYLVHAVFFFRSKTTRATMILFGLLAALLICNVSGCRAQLPH
ncbi:MAG: hypothetical protein ACJ8M1_15500 [Chthoniobacterales bacterium]